MKKFTFLFVALFLAGNCPLSGQLTTNDQYDGFVEKGSQKDRLTNTWTGGGATDYWHVDENWSLGHAPVSTEQAVIPDGSNFHAIIDGATGVCNSLNLGESIGSDVWLEIRGDTLAIDLDIFIYGRVEMDHNDGRLIIGDDVYWFSGSSSDMQANSSLIEVSGDWRFYSGSDVQMEYGVVNFTGTVNSYIYTYDNDNAFNALGIYKTGGGYVEHGSASSQPLRTNNYFYIHTNGEFRSNTSQPVIVKGYLSKTSTGVFNMTNGTFVMDGTSQVIQIIGPGYFNNLTISPENAVTLNTDIDVNGNLLIEQGALNPDNHKINIAGNWRNEVGDAGFLEAGSRVIFDNPTMHSYVRSNENFDTLEVDIFAALRVDTATFTVTCDHYLWTSGGIDVLTGTFTAEDLVQSGIYGGWWLNPTGTINIFQDGGQYIDLYGDLNIYGGVMNVFGGQDDSYWGSFSAGSITMSGGILDFINWGVRLYNSYAFTENITGGTILIPGSFYASRPDFTPTGGTIYFKSSTTGHISHDSGSNFYNIEINKTTKGATEGGERTLYTESQIRRTPPDESPGTGPGSRLKEKKAPSAKGTNVYMESDLDINGNLTITNGVLDANTSNYSINIAGHWTNNAGLTGFDERNGTVTFDGASGRDITTSETFHDLVLDKTYVGVLALEISSGNLITVSNDLNINDGTLEINSNSILDVFGNITIATGAALNADDNPTTIRVQGDFTDNNTYFSSTNGFYAGYNSTVLFNGSTTDQFFSTLTTTGIFNNLTIDKSGGHFRSYESLEFRGDFLLQQGSWWDATPWLTHSFRGDFTVSPGTNYYTTTGTSCRFIGSADQVIDFDPVTTGGYFYYVIIDKSVAKDDIPEGENSPPVIKTTGGERENRSNTVTLSTDVIALSGGDLDVNYGTLDLNGHYFRAAGHVKIHNGGKISVDDDASLEVGGSDSLIVFSGGTLEVIGSSGHEALVEGHISQNYVFEVRSGGTISARYAVFEETSDDGIYVQSGALINSTNDFDFCTFRFGLSGTATLLRIDNNQTITIDSAVFPTSTTTESVTKTLNQGNVTFVGAAGIFSGPDYEDDAFGRIHWAEYGVWNGTTSTNWNISTNWGFSVVPTSSMDVIIPAGCPNYPLLTAYLGVNTAAYNYDCKSLEVQAGGSLTVSGVYDIISYGTITSSGDLDIGDDYVGQSGSELIIYSDTVRFGNGTSNSIINLNSGAVIYQYGGHLMAEAYSLTNGSQYNGSGGTTHLSVFGSAPLTQTIVINDPDSYFNSFQIDAATNGTLGASTEDLNSIGNFKVFGTFDPLDKTVTTTYMDVYGTLNMDNGLIEIGTNGPYFHSGSTLDMTGGTIDAENVFLWYGGSTGNASGGEIYAEGQWQFLDGCNVQLGAGNTVYFQESGASSITCQDSDSSFGTVDLDKTPSSSSDIYINAASTDTMRVAGNLYLRDGNQFHLQDQDLIVQGELVNEDGSEMDMITGAGFTNDLDFTLNGSLTMTGGNVLIHGAFTEAVTGSLNMSGGTFIVDAPYISSKASFYLHGSLTLSDGIFEISHNVMNLSSTSTNIISGGTIRAGGTFIAYNNVFQPTGGDVELLNYSGPGSPYVELYTGNWFRNLIVSSDVSWYISGLGASTLTIQRDLTINSGGLNGSDDIVNVGDDWINNEGITGFNAGSGTVNFNGTLPSPAKQVISGSNTFYDVNNQNVNATVEFAGPTTINNDYNAGAGGAACETFITGTPIDIQNQLNLAQGTVSLSSSAPVVSTSSLAQGGTLQVTNGNFTADDLADYNIVGDYTLHNGQINLYQDNIFFVDPDADLTIHGGEFNIYGGSDIAYWPYSGPGSLTMDGGVLDFKSVGIYLDSDSFSESITGGLIRTVGDFLTSTSVTFFTPSGGTVELYGDGNSDVELQPGCYFHDFVAGKNPPGSVTATSDLNIKGELRVKSAEFNTNGFTIDVGD